MVIYNPIKSHEEAKQVTYPWNRSLWYWEVDHLRNWIKENGIDTTGLTVEGLREAARLLRNRPNLGHEEVHYFATQKQESRQ